MIDLFIEEYIDAQIENKYNSDRNDIETFIVEFNKYLKLCKIEYPYNFLSHYHFKKWIESFKNLELLPTREKYFYLSKNSELFHSHISLYIKLNKQPVLFKIPVFIDINKLSQYLISNGVNTYSFEVSDFKKIINPDYFEQYDTDNLIRKQGRAYLEKIKEKNPIIIMRGSDMVENQLINGNHRVIAALESNKKSIDAYVVDFDKCCSYGIISQYDRLYKSILQLRKKVKYVF